MRNPICEKQQHAKEHTYCRVKFIQTVCNFFCRHNYSYRIAVGQFSTGDYVWYNICKDDVDVTTNSNFMTKDELPKKKRTKIGTTSTELPGFSYGSEMFINKQSEIVAQARHFLSWPKTTPCRAFLPGNSEVAYRDPETPSSSLHLDPVQPTPRLQYTRRLHPGRSYKQRIHHYTSSSLPCLADDFDLSPNLDV